jgi:ABC-type antimicrobial peptide transport system permease subunit
VPLTLQQTLAYTSNSSAYANGDRRKPWMDEDRIAWLNLVARVAPDRQAQAAANPANGECSGLQQLAAVMDDARERSSTVARSLVVTSFGRGFSSLRARFSDALYTLAAMVAIVLLVTCANLANLLLARATGRSREMGIRLSLGATTGRLVRQHLAESLLLAVAGGAASLFAAQWTSAFLARAVFNRSGDLPPVLISTPASGSLRRSCRSPVHSRSGSRRRSGRSAPASRLDQRQPASQHTCGDEGMRPLVVAQLALSFAVVFGAVLLGRTLTYFSRIDRASRPSDS